MTTKAVMQCRDCGAVCWVGGAGPHLDLTGHERFDLVVPDALVCGVCHAAIEVSDMIVHAAETGHDTWLVRMTDGSTREIIED